MEMISLASLCSAAPQIPLGAGSQAAIPPPQKTSPALIVNPLPITYQTYMKNIDIVTHVTALSIDELDSADRELVQQAVLSTRNAYSPYSHFSVGACVRLSDGSIMTGANQENAAYPSGLCAERTAIFSAQAQHPELHIMAIAIAARDIEGRLTRKPVTPCGACRQVMIEIEQRYKRAMRVLLYGEDTVLVIDSASELLPLSFAGDDMNPQTAG